MNKLKKKKRKGTEKHIFTQKNNTAHFDTKIIRMLCHEKFQKVMGSHGFLRAQKSTNPVVC